MLSVNCTADVQYYLLIHPTSNKKGSADAESFFHVLAAIAVTRPSRWITDP